MLHYFCDDGNGRQTKIIRQLARPDSAGYAWCRHFKGMNEQGNLFKKKRRRRKSERKNVSVRPTPDQLQLLHERAASFGFKSLSKYLIERGLREGEMIVSADRERIERLLFEVRRIGRNVNQISRAINSDGGKYRSTELDRAMAEVARLVGEVGETLNG
jgi:uncharacterized protein (DUF1778 family)